MKKLGSLLIVCLLSVSLVGCNFLFSIGKGSTTSTAPTADVEEICDVEEPAMATETAEAEYGDYDNYSGKEMGFAMESATNDDLGAGFAMTTPAMDYNTEEYNSIVENGFDYVSTNPLSTFAIDVDTGSYCNMRRMILEGYGLADIPSGAVRTEELVNYFDYKLDNKNKSNGKFSVQSEIHDCPWNTRHDLLVLTAFANDTRVKSAGNNFVYLIDTSGSMDSPDKIYLVQESFKKLTKALGAKDIVSIVTYSGYWDVVLEGCPAKDYGTICEALDSLRAEGCTNGSGGIEAAYDCALRNYIKNGNNRVILASDGDMNLGITSQSCLVDLIKEKKDSGVFLTTLGYGYGNYSDANMEQIADAGNGNYFYIDCIEEAERVLVEKLMQTTLTVAKDVKFQMEFNPNVVSEYRLIGYENRTMSSKDFEDDTKDGGEVGAGQSVTVVYELVPANSSEKTDKKLKYQETQATMNNSNEVATLSIRYKHPNGTKSDLEEYPISITEGRESADWNFVAGVTEFSLVLHDSEYKGNANLNQAVELINKGYNEDNYREEIRDLITCLIDKEQWDGRFEINDDDYTLSLYEEEK